MTASEAGRDDVPAPPEPPAPPGGTGRPSYLTRNELVYGLVVAAELVTVSILNLVVTGGKGAPTHPDKALAAVGIVVAVAVFPLLLFRSRTIAGFATIIGSLFVSLPKVPDRLSVTHAFALIFPIAYALIVTQRQRKALKTQPRPARGAAGGSEASSRSGRPTRRERNRSRGSDTAAVSAGPRPSARYTPPKARQRRR